MLFNHVMRSFLFGQLLSPEGPPLDDEVIFVSAVLHDLGLTEAARGSRRFEVEGADAARRFLIDQNVDDRRAWLVWDTIALHPWGDLNLLKEPEARVVQRGIVADVVGSGLEDVEAVRVADVLSAFPRLGFKAGFFELLLREAAEKPHTHVVHPAHMVAHHCCGGVAIPDARAIIDAAPFPE
jgi:hypothetical protein